MAAFDHHDPDYIRNLSAKNEMELTDVEKWRLDHHRMHEKHKGHESMHSEMVLILFSVLIAAQIALVQWKKFHMKSYQIVTLFGMWLIPAVLSIKFTWWRFLCIWLVFTCITTYVSIKATRHPIAGTTPRLVYKWFLLVHKLSYGLGIIGYAIVMCTLFGLNLLLLIQPETSMDVGLLLLFYGLYLGVVSRDLAEVCTDTMASKLGYYSTTGLPSRQLDPDTCALCGNKLLVLHNENAIIEKTFRLNCQHLFHEFCIRGWCIVGKKQTCPYCKEKVDLKRMFTSPWERPHMLYGNLLDWVRYLITWQPIIIILVQGINWLLGLE